MKAISCRMEPKKFGNYKGRKGHDLREKGRVPSYVDADKCSQNSIIMPTPTSNQALQMMNEAKKAAGARQKFNKDRNTLIYDGILSFSIEARDTVHRLSRDEQDRRALQSAQDVCNLHGGKLVGLVVHRDETTLHIHFQMLAVGSNGNLLRISREECKRRQDVAAQAWSDLGISRGKEKALRIAEGDSFSKIIHRTVRELHEDLPRELAELQAENERLREANLQLSAELSKLNEEYQAMLKQLGIAKEVLQSEQGLADDTATPLCENGLGDSGPKL